MTTTTATNTRAAWFTRLDHDELDPSSFDGYLNIGRVVVGAGWYDHTPGWSDRPAVYIDDMGPCTPDEARCIAADMLKAADLAERITQDANA